MIIISASSDNGVSAQSERCTILEFNAIATPALGRESSPASSARLEADVSVGFLLIFTIIVSMFFDGGMFGKEKTDNDIVITRVLSYFQLISYGSITCFRSMGIIAAASEILQ